MKNVPLATVERVAKYLRCLNRLSEKGIKVVSSKELAEHTRTSPEQVRKDLSYFGRFGKTGTGYDTQKLSRKLEKILKVQRKWNVCIIGAGSLGSALARYQGFKDTGYNVVALFDSDPEKIGEKMGQAEVYDIANFKDVVKKKDIKMAILAVPKESIEEIEELLSKANNIRGILNFVPVTIKLKTRRKVAIIDVDLAQKLYILSYLIKRGREMT